MNIELKYQSRLKKHRSYPLTFEEKNVMSPYINENIAHGIIEPSLSHFAAPWFFLKQGSTWRLWVDYLDLNTHVTPTISVLPRIVDIVQSLADAQVFSSLDLRGAYNLGSIAPGNEYKRAFVTHVRVFQYKVMPFGFMTAPSVFQTLMMVIFKDLVRSSVYVYLDNMLVFSKSVEEHSKYLLEVLSRL